VPVFRAGACVQGWCLCSAVTIFKCL